ncbi:hypothetical protein MMC29_004573, partial [Sticta canariensis]|nr:hypothetical protein [Sticta canariensis]
MPGRDLTGSMDIAPSPNFSLFKAHKTFPRRKTQTDGRNPSHSLGLEQSRVHEEDQESYRSSQKIRSWIPEPSPHHAAPDHDLPLTPPINMMEHEEESWIEDRILADGTVASNLTRSENGIATPMIQRSPPTPEITPPRVHDGIRALAPRSPSRDPSLRADSFETARERLSSDDESPDIDSPSMRPARQTWLRDLGNSKLRDIGLGLGLESEDEDPTPTQMTPKHSLKKYDFGAFDTSWAGEKTSINGRGINEQDHGLRHSDLRRRRFQHWQRLPTHPLPRSPNASEETSQPTPTRSLSLRQRVEKRQQNISASTERFAEQIDWPMKEDDFDLDAKLREVDNRRFSQISATSTVVEAMVIDTPPQRRQTLRHTGKIPPLNFDMPQANHSNRSSIISTGSTRRRLPRNGITPDRENRRSVTTDVSGSMNSGLGKVRQDNIPQISRPTTAPEETIGYFDLPQGERCTEAAVMPFTIPSNPNTYVVEETPVVVGPSVSTSPKVASNETSQIISVPSANIVSSPVQPGQPHPVFHLSEPSEIQGINLDRSIAGEWSALRPRSALVTPYSLRSTHSSTPGTLEVNEATAISIYPHTNKSILVIQQMAGGDANERAGHSAIIAGNANIALPGPIAPTLIHQSRRPLNSPLKNPRDPPQPPDFKIIPPTPANVPPTDEIDSRRSPPSPKTRLSDTVSLVKRALSARRYSDSFVSPITRSLVRRSTITTRRPSAGDDPDSKLHPFWRPRGFWDDLSASSSDSDSEFGNSGVLVGSPVDAQPHKNSISQAPNDRSVLRSTSLTRRLTGSFSLKSGNSQQRARTHRRSRSEGSQSNQPIKSNHSLASLDNNHSYLFLQHSALKRIMPRLGYPVHFIGFKGLAERMEKAK